MIKHLTPKSEEELKKVKLNERKEIIKFAEKKLSTFKKLPDEVNMDIMPSLRFTIYPITGEKKASKFWYFYTGMDNDKCTYSLKLKKSKSNKWRVVAVEYYEAEFPKSELMTPEN